MICYIYLIQNKWVVKCNIFLSSGTFPLVLMVFNFGALTFPAKSNALKCNGVLQILQKKYCVTLTPYFQCVTCNGLYFLPTYAINKTFSLKLFSGQIS